MKGLICSIYLRSTVNPFIMLPFSCTSIIIGLVVIFSSNYPNQDITPGIPFNAASGVQPDTMVNCCKLVRAGFIYGEKSTEKNPMLDAAELDQFNSIWRDVFDVP